MNNCGKSSFFKKVGNGIILVLHLLYLLYILMRIKIFNYVDNMHVLLFICLHKHMKGVKVN